MGKRGENHGKYRTSKKLWYNDFLYSSNKRLYQCPAVPYNTITFQFFKAVSLCN